MPILTNCFNVSNKWNTSDIDILMLGKMFVVLMMSRCEVSLHNNYMKFSQNMSRFLMNISSLKKVSSSMGFTKSISKV